jgi:hypothetical protein
MLSFDKFHAIFPSNANVGWCIHTASESRFFVAECKTDTVIFQITPVDSRGVKDGQTKSQKALNVSRPGSTTRNRLGAGMAF